MLWPRATVTEGAGQVEVTVVVAAGAGAPTETRTVRDQARRPRVFGASTLNVRVVTFDPAGTLILKRPRRTVFVFATRREASITLTVRRKLLTLTLPRMVIVDPTRTLSGADTPGRAATSGAGAADETVAAPATRPEVRRTEDRTTPRVVFMGEPCAMRGRRSGEMQELPDPRQWIREFHLVGVTGFEPAASSSRTTRATKLRHTPIR